MSEWEPWMVVALFFALGILFSVSGAMWLEKRIEQIRIRRRRNTFSLVKGSGKKPHPQKKKPPSPGTGSGPMKKRTISTPVNETPLPRSGLPPEGSNGSIRSFRNH